MTTYNPIAAAIYCTKKVASLKDWRCRSKKNRAMREIARDWLENWNGYAIMSIRDLKAFYPEYVNERTNMDERFIWGIEYYGGQIDFVPWGREEEAEK